MIIKIYTDNFLLDINDVTAKYGTRLVDFEPKYHFDDLSDYVESINNKGYELKCKPSELANFIRKVYPDVIISSLYIDDTGRYVQFKTRKRGLFKDALFLSNTSHGEIDMTLDYDANVFKEDASRKYIYYLHAI